MRAFFSPKVSPWYIYVALAIVEIRNTWGLHRRAATGARMARRSRSPGRSGSRGPRGVRRTSIWRFRRAFSDFGRAGMAHATSRHRSVTFKDQAPFGFARESVGAHPASDHTLTHFQHFQLARTPDKKPPPSLLWVQGV